MTAITISLNEIRANHPCHSGWNKLLKAKGKTSADDERFPLSNILETNDLEDCLWALRCADECLHNLWRKFAVWAARRVEHLMEDERSKKALEVAWRHSNGEATDNELAAARAAAGAAAWCAAMSSAMASAMSSAEDAAWYAAMTASEDAAMAASDAAARASQAKKLKQILDAGEWVEDQE